MWSWAATSSSVFGRLIESSAELNQEGASCKTESYYFSTQGCCRVLSSLVSALAFELLETAAARALLLKNVEAMYSVLLKVYESFQPEIAIFLGSSEMSSPAVSAAVGETRLHVTRAALRRDQSGAPGILHTPRFSPSLYLVSPCVLLTSQ